MKTAKNKIVAGIELGSSKVATIIAQVTLDSVSLEKNINLIGVSATESKGVKKGQIVDIEEAVESMITSVESAERMAGYNLDNAYISLGGAHVSSQNSHGVVAVSNPEGEISFEDVDRVVEAASAISLPSSRELIHVLPREFIVDGETGVKDPVGMSGVRLEVQTHLITASNAAVKNIRKAVNEVGIAANELVYSGLAASEAALTKTEKELGFNSKTDIEKYGLAKFSKACSLNLFIHSCSAFSPLISEISFIVFVERPGSDL